METVDRESNSAWHAEIRPVITPAHTVDTGEYCGAKAPHRKGADALAPTAMACGCALAERCVSAPPNTHTTSHRYSYLHELSKQEIGNFEVDVRRPPAFLCCLYRYEIDSFEHA